MMTILLSTRQEINDATYQSLSVSSDINKEAILFLKKTSYDQKFKIYTTQKVKLDDIFNRLWERYDSAHICQTVITNEIPQFYW